MGDKRQNNQLVLAFMEEDRGEAPKDLPEGTESSWSVEIGKQPGTRYGTAQCLLRLARDSEIDC